MGTKRDVFSLSPSGIVRDLPPDAVAQADYNNGRNVTFRDGIASRVLGYEPIYGTPVVAPQLLANLRDSINNFWIYPGKAQIGATDGATHAHVTPTTGWVDPEGFNQWSATFINDAVVLNQPNMPPMYWTGGLSNRVEYLPGWPVGTLAQLVRASRYHLFAFNLTDTNGSFPNGVLWSDAAEPGTIPPTWQITQANQAGSVELAAGGGAIMDAAVLRDAMIIYKETEVWAAQYVGGNQVYAFRKVLGMAGALSRNCVASYNGLHVVLTSNDVMLFDGQQARSIIDKRNKRWLFNTMDSKHYKNSFVVYYAQRNEVWIVFPSAGNEVPNTALVYCGDSDSWGERDIVTPCIGVGIVAENDGAAAWDTITDTWESVSIEWDQSTYQVINETLLASVDGGLTNVDAGITNNGALISASLLKSGLALGSPQRKKLIRRLWPRMAGSAGTVVTLRAGGHDQPNGPISWAAPVSFTIGVDEKIDTFATGRYLAFEITSESEQPWAITGIDCEYSLQGEW